MELRRDPRLSQAWVAEHDGRLLVFGLEWAPLLGRDVARLARRRARIMRATHYAWSGGDHASVGGIRLTRAPWRRLRCHSAALAASLALGMSSAAVLLRIRDDLYWLAAWHAGAVIARTDRVHASREQAMQALSDLALRYPGLPLYGNVALDGMQAMDWRALTAALDGRASLHRLQGRAAGLGGAAAMAVALAGGWSILDRAPPPAPAVPAVDPQQAWEQAIDHRLSAVHWHAPSDLAPVFVSLRRLPLAVTGWRLRDANCQAQGPDWLCQARYARGVLGRNRHLADVLPPGWQLRVELLDGADLSWRVAGEPAILRWRTLGSRHDTDIGLASRLQDATRLFTTVRIAPWRGLQVDAPVDHAGVDVPWPADWHAPGLREIEFEGPLHAYALLATLGVSASWQRLHLQVSSPSSVGLASHRALVRLQGLIYETH